MTQTPSSHRRSPTHSSKSKATRPVLHRRGTSATVTFSKLGSGKDKDREIKPSDDDLDMASFLNFWYVTLIYILASWHPSILDMLLAVICVPFTGLFSNIKADPVPSAMCENQITTPNNSLLYCSERYVPWSIFSISVSDPSQFLCLGDCRPYLSIYTNISPAAAVKTLANLSRHLSHPCLPSLPCPHHPQHHLLSLNAPLCPQ